MPATLAAATAAKPQMQGRITKFIDQHEVGVIAATDGRSFRFTARDIVNRGALSVGAEVDFLVAAARPVEIFVLDGTPFTAFAGTA